MSRRAFDQQLQRLQDEILALGSRVEDALVRSVGTLKFRDFEGARRVIAEDRAINEQRYAIEAEALSLIATQQPMAGDMRRLAAILEIAGELERMGDYAKGIARISLRLGPEPLLKPLIDLPLMAEKTRIMLRGALEAFVHGDLQRAQAIPATDDEVDALYNQVYRELMTYVMADPRLIEQANLLLWAAHNLERAADRVNNICERTVYAVTGRLMEFDSEEANSDAFC